MNPRYRRCKCLRPRVRHRRLGRWGGRSSRRPRGVKGGMGGGCDALLSGWSGVHWWRGMQLMSCTTDVLHN